MTYGDRKFMMEVGIEPCTLDDRFPHPLPPPLPPGPVIPSLTEKDACWLGKLKVTWEEDPERGFVPPRSLWEYLGGYPNGMLWAAGRLGLDLSDDDMDDMGQDLIVMFLDFVALDLEHIVEMYAFLPAARPAGCRWEQFHEYVTLRVMSGMLFMLRTEPTGTDDLGKSLGS